LEASVVRVLVVDDYEPFRRFVCSTLGRRQDLQVIGEVSDGLEAVHKAERLRPDLVLLDLGLPILNGIEAAQRIRMLSPDSKILFVSQESSSAVVQEALGAGACGYVIKTDARSELLTAVDAVLLGEQFLGCRFSSHDFSRATNVAAHEGLRSNSVCAPPEQNIQIASRHEAGFYSDDRCFLDDLTPFIGAALKSGNAAIVAGPSHTGTVFFCDCKSSTWISMLLLSCVDILLWMLLTRSRHSCSEVCLIQSDV
jgi:DNA-binding NarL/FixJ family response regulator